jgi:hypothetical protein
MEGWQLIGDANQFLNSDTYETEYKANYPQMTKVLCFKQQVINNISQLPENGALPVGVLFGKEASTLTGETQRFSCTDYVSQTYIMGRGYDYDPDNASKYKEHIASGLKPLGKFKVARGALNKVTQLDEALIRSLQDGTIYCVVSGSLAGSQVAFIKTGADNEKIGVVVDTE